MNSLEKRARSWVHENVVLSEHCGIEYEDLILKLTRILVEQDNAWIRLDVDDERTWPDRSRACLIAWESWEATGESFTHPAMHMRIADDDGGWQWADYDHGEFAWPLKGLRAPTHWVYAPLFGRE